MINVSAAFRDLCRKAPASFWRASHPLLYNQQSLQTLNKPILTSPKRMRHHRHNLVIKSKFIYCGKKTSTWPLKGCKNTKVWKNKGISALSEFYRLSDLCGRLSSLCFTYWNRGFKAGSWITWSGTKLWMWNNGKRLESGGGGVRSIFGMVRSHSIQKSWVGPLWLCWR